jgi:hypothetical protein
VIPEKLSDMFSMMGLPSLIKETVESAACGRRIENSWTEVGCSTGSNICPLTISVKNSLLTQG